MPRSGRLRGIPLSGAACIEGLRRITRTAPSLKNTSVNGFESHFLIHSYLFNPTTNPMGDFCYCNLAKFSSPCEPL
jgi:hypothetical protein